MWFLIAFLSPILYGLANVIDHRLTNLFQNAWTLAFFSVCFNILFLPLTLLIERPDWPPLAMLPFFALIALIECLYLYPYYKALQCEDTSVVTSLFSLGRIFVPILAFLFVDEQLSFIQYAGFFIITLCGALLTLDHQTLRLNKSFFYMLICSLLLSIQAVLYKYIFENISWSTGFVWTTVMTALIVLFFLLLPKLRNDILLQAKALKKHIPLFTFEELLSFGGAVTSTYAIALAPVTLVKSVGSFQPFFVLLYALLFTRFLPHFFREKIDRRSLLKKFILFSGMGFGMALIV